jgi:NTE family protein
VKFIERVNDWIDEGYLPADQFTHTDIHRIQMDQRFDSTTKVDRDRAFIEELLATGRESATAFLDGR